MSTATPPRPASTGYEVSRPHGKCSLCQQDLVPGQRLTTGLRETPESMERIDCCEACSPNLKTDSLLAFWRTVMPEAQQKKKVFVDDEVLCTLLERLGSASEPLKLNFRFVLALVLLRKRKLVHESTVQRDGVEFWVVRLRGQETTMDLLNPHLDEQQIMDVSTALGQILNEEL